MFGLEERSEVIDRVEAQLRREFPDLLFERNANSLNVPPSSETGFRVELVDAGQEIVPVLGGWVEYGVGEEEAVPIFLAGVTGEARVREVSRAGVTYRWTVDVRRADAWVSEGNHYSIPVFPGALPLFGRKRERVLWNDPSRLGKGGR